MNRGVLALSALAAVVASLMLAASSAAGVSSLSVFATPLNGQEEVTDQGEPGQGDLDGRGFALIRVDTELSEVCWTILVRRIELPASAAHIHQAAAGSNGPIVVPLSAPTTGGGFLGRLGIGIATGCTVSEEFAGQIAADPSGFYVNVHNEPFPNGAVRGQL
jgi:hypothetical protein